MRSHSVLFISGLLSAFQGYVAAAPSPNARSVNIPGIDTNDVTDFDCPGTTQTDLTQQELQDAMDEFAYTLYTEKDVEGAFNKYVASNYVQHSPSMGDGRAKAIESLTSGFSAEGNTFEIARVMVGPEYTTIHLKAEVYGQPTNVFDIYKTQGSCIIEHWDCLQDIANKTVSTHPYF